MPSLIERTGAFFLICCAAACLNHAAAATELNYLPAPSPSSDKPGWAGFYFQDKAPAAPGRAPWSALDASKGGFASPNLITPPVNENFGYNFQSGNLVFGLEGSLAAANFDGKFTSPYLPGTGAWTPNMNWLGTVTGHVGYSFGQWLPYVKAGFAAADVASPLQGAPTGGFSQGTEVGGWTGGVGLEYQISPKLSLGLEYLYTDLSAGIGGAPGGPALTGSPEVYSTALKSQSLLGRLNYKAGW
jgi:opacity protein-like surface antigen